MDIVRKDRLAQHNLHPPENTTLIDRWMDGWMDLQAKEIVISYAGQARAKVRRHGEKAREDKAPEKESKR